MSNLRIFHDAAEKELKKIDSNCKLTVVKEAKIRNPKLTTSACIFRIPDPYKDESRYTNGLNLLIDNFAHVTPNSILRIYYDDSVLKKDNKWEPIMDKLKNTEFVELIHYDFPQFKIDGSDIYHEGLFGTIMRILPLFDFSDVQETIMLSDIDYKNRGEIVFLYKKAHRGIAALKDYKLDFVLSTYSTRAYLFESRLTFTEILEKYDFFLRMLVEMTICKKKLNKQFLFDFITCVVKKCPLYKNWIDDTMKKIDCENIPDDINKGYRIRQCAEAKKVKDSPKGIFIFGIDEFLLNLFILTHFLKNKIPFIIRYAMPNMAHYHYITYLKFQKREVPLKLMLDMYHAILGKQLHSVNDVNKAFQEVDKQIFKFSKDNIGVVIHNEHTQKMFDRIDDFFRSRVDELLELPNLELFEKQMFEFLKNTKKEHFSLGQNFYEVTYKPNNHYELILCR